MKIKLVLISTLVAISLAPAQLTAGPPGTKGGFGDIWLDDKKSAKKENTNTKPRQEKPSNKKTEAAKKSKIGYRSIWDPVAY